MRRLFILTTLLLLTVQVFGQNYKYVNTETLNVRENAGKRYNVVGQVMRGEKITALSESGNWTEIEIENGKKGYVSTKFLSSTNDTQTSNNKKFPWINILIVLGLLGYVVYKIKNFFSGLFSGSVSSKRREPRTETSRQTPVPSYQPQINPLRWYNCKNCNIKIETSKQPTSLNCSGDTFHKWTDLGEAGNQAHSCKNCGTTVYTTKQPTSINCSRDTFHKWTKLS